MTGQVVQGTYQTLVQSLPFVERAQRDARELPRQRRAGRRTAAARRSRRSSFERVSFAYKPETPVLTDINFAVSGGEAIGIVGPSGAGKSTLVQLLLRLRAPGRGRYLINGVPGRELRTRGLVPAGLLRSPGTAAAARLGRRQHPLLSRARRRAGRTRRAAGAHPRRHHELAGRLRGDRRAARGRRLGRPAAADLPRSRARRTNPTCSMLDEPTSALDPQSEALISASLKAIRSRADAVHRRPPHVDAGDVRSRDGDRRRAAWPALTPNRCCSGTTPTTGTPPQLATAGHAD